MAALARPLRTIAACSCLRPYSSAAVARQIEPDEGNDKPYPSVKLALKNKRAAKRSKQPCEEPSLNDYWDLQPKNIDIPKPRSSPLDNRSSQIEYYTQKFEEAKSILDRSFSKMQLISLARLVLPTYPSAPLCRTKGNLIQALVTQSWKLKDPQVIAKEEKALMASHAMRAEGNVRMTERMLVTEDQYEMLLAVRMSGNHFICEKRRLSKAIIFRSSDNNTPIGHHTLVMQGFKKDVEELKGLLEEFLQTVKTTTLDVTTRSPIQLHMLPIISKRSKVSVKPPETKKGKLRAAYVDTPSRSSALGRAKRMIRVVDHESYISNNRDLYYHAQSATPEVQRLLPCSLIPYAPRDRPPWSLSASTSVPLVRLTSPTGLLRFDSTFDLYSFAKSNESQPPLSLQTIIAAKFPQVSASDLRISIQYGHLVFNPLQTGLEILDSHSGDVTCLGEFQSWLSTTAHKPFLLSAMPPSPVAPAWSSNESMPTLMGTFMRTICKSQTLRRATYYPAPGKSNYDRITLLANDVHSRTEPLQWVAYGEKRWEADLMLSESPVDARIVASHSKPIDNPALNDQLITDAQKPLPEEIKLGRDTYFLAKDYRVRQTELLEKEGSVLQRKIERRVDLINDAQTSTGLVTSSTSGLDGVDQLLKQLLQVHAAEQDSNLSSFTSSQSSDEAPSLSPWMFGEMGTKSNDTHDFTSSLGSFDSSDGD